jgi:hypothetical protein
VNKPNQTEEQLINLNFTYNKPASASAPQRSAKTIKNYSLTNFK